MFANSSLSVRIPYAPTIPAEFATDELSPAGKSLSDFLAQSWSHVSITRWKQSWPNHHQEPFAKKSGGVMARLLVEKNLRAVTRAALPQVPIP
jgi:hypothetical protein